MTDKSSSMSFNRSFEEVDEAVFSINGQVHKVGRDVAVETSLNSYLRNHLKLTGTKVMCHEGSCGSCVVNMKIYDPQTARQRSMPVNSCLFPVLACHGTSITTVEGLGSRAAGYNKVQSTLAHFNGSQCGFCSPGFVMTMYSLLSEKGELKTKEAEMSLSGNLCRCTGYRPILDAFKSLTSDPPPHLLDKLIDIEESHQLCPNKMCGKSCSDCFKDAPPDYSLDYPELCFAERSLSIRDDRAEWYRVASVGEIFQVFDRIEDRSYRLVAGNTASGVTVKKSLPWEVEPEVYIDINGIPSLKSVSVSNDRIVVGSGVSLASLIEYLDRVSTEKPQFRYTEQISQHLKHVANTPVRHLATIGGNVCFSVHHADFPSDISLLLDAVNAQVTLVFNSGVTREVSMAELRAMDLNKKVITAVTLPSLSASHHLKSYKVMQSAQNSAAVVNGAFLYCVSQSGVVRSRPSVVYSGLSHSFRHAYKTEAFLSGKNIFSRDTLVKSLKILKNEVIAESDPPNFSASYRNLLALSLFYRSVLSINGTKVDVRLQSGSTAVERSISSGKQTFYTDKKEWPLTQPIPKLEAQIQCSGEAKYTKDLSEEGALFGKFVLATKIAEIQSIDSSKAKGLRGVVGFYTAADIPGVNNLLYPTEKDHYQPMELLCSGKVTYQGQPVALIVAVDEETAVRAARRVSVSYKKVRTDVLTTIRSVLDSTQSDRVVKRDSFRPAKEPGEAKFKFSGELEVGGQYSHAMETQSAIVSPRENGQLRVRSATQAITHTVGAVSQITKTPLNKIECSVTRVGGAYGSKIVSQLWIAAGAALAAVKLSKPVRMSFTLKEELTVIGKRTNVLVRYQGGVDEAGKIQGLDISIYYNFGSQISTIYQTILPYLRYIIPNCYDYSTWSFTVYTITTDLPPASILRSPCFNQLYSLTEQVMDHAAFTAGLDPVKVRLANAGDRFISKYIAQWRESTEYDKRMTAVHQFNKENRWKKRGLALSCMRYPFDYYYREMGCSVSVLWPDATVQVIHGAVELGQGVNTKVCQIVAHELGIPVSDVNVLSTSSTVTPNNHETVASVAGELVSYAALKCCLDLNERIDRVKKSMVNPSWKDVVSKMFFSGVHLNANYVCGIEKDKSQLFNYNVYGVGVTETEIDLLTGERKISRVDILQDVGKSLSPELDVGQVEGAFIMGVGLVTGERLVIDPTTGALLNNTLWNYKIPTSKDIPEDFRITFVPNSTNPGSVLGSKAVGEPSLALSVSVINSLRNALMSARQDAGQPLNWITLDSPCTIESILMNAATSPDQFIL